MNSTTVFKIKDSVDLFLSNERYLMAYFMNSRQRKSFKVNSDMLHLLELIDGENTVQALQDKMYNQFEINPDNTIEILTLLLKNKIIMIKFFIPVFTRKPFSKFYIIRHLNSISLIKKSVGQIFSIKTQMIKVTNYGSSFLRFSRNNALVSTINVSGTIRKPPFGGFSGRAGFEPMEPSS